jgi:hypothetical protein
LNPVRITISPQARRWLWFFGIYTASIVGFAAVTGLLALMLPK